MSIGTEAVQGFARGEFRDAVLFGDLAFGDELVGFVLCEKDVFFNLAVDRISEFHVLPLYIILLYSMGMSGRMIISRSHALCQFLYIRT